MREKYESLSASALKELAKARGIKSVTAMKKSDCAGLSVHSCQKVKTLRKTQSRQLTARSKNRFAEKKSYIRFRFIKKSPITDILRFDYILKTSICQVQ